MGCTALRLITRVLLSNGDGVYHPHRMHFCSREEINWLVLGYVGKGQDECPGHFLGVYIGTSMCVSYDACTTVSYDVKTL